MLNQVLASFPENLQVLLRVRLMQRLSGGDLRASTMHLQRTGGGDDNHSVWGKATDPALDITELLHTHVGPETPFCEDIPPTRRILTLLGPRELQGNAVGKDGGVSMGDIGERASVNKDRCTLQSDRLEDARVHKWWSLTSNVCIKFGLIASFMSTARAPLAPMSSAVIGSPRLLVATTILPNLTCMSSRLVASANTAMTSLATEMSNPVTRS